MIFPRVIRFPLDGYFSTPFQFEVICGLPVLVIPAVSREVGPYLKPSSREERPISIWPLDCVPPHLRCWNLAPCSPIFYRNSHPSELLPYRGSYSTPADRFRSALVSDGFRDSPEFEDVAHVSVFIFL